MSLKSYVLAGAVALLLVAPVSANVQETDIPPDAVNQIVHLGTYFVETGELVPPSPDEGHIPSVTLEFEQRVASGFFFSVPNTTNERSNLMDLVPGSYIRQVEVGFATDSAAPISLSQAFYASDDMTLGTLTTAQTINGTDAVYDITVGGLLGGACCTGYTITIDFGDNGFNVPQADMALGTVYTDPGDSSMLCGGGANRCIGPLLASPGPGPSPGTTDLWIDFDPAAWLSGTFNGVFFFGGFPPATFWYGVFSGSPSVTRVPTLSGVGLALLVGLLLVAATLFMRRQRQS